MRQMEHYWYKYSVETYKITYGASCRIHIRIPLELRLFQIPFRPVWFSCLSRQEDQTKISKFILLPFESIHVWLPLECKRAALGRAQAVQTVWHIPFWYHRGYSFCLMCYWAVLRVKSSLSSIGCHLVQIIGKRDGPYICMPSLFAVYSPM